MPTALPRQQDPNVPVVNPIYQQTAPAISQAQDRSIPVTAPAMPAPSAPPSGPAPGTNPALAAAAAPAPGSATDEYLTQWRSSMDASRSVIDRDLGEAFRQIQGANAGAAQTLAQLPGAVAQSYAMNAPDPAAAAASGPAGIAAGAVSSDVNLGGAGYGPLQAALDANAANQGAASGLIAQAAAAAAAGRGGSGGGGGGGDDGLTPLQLLRDQRDQEEVQREMEQYWHQTAREDALYAQENRWRTEDQVNADAAWERENADEDADTQAAWAREDDIMARELEAQSRQQRDAVLFEQGWDYGFDELEAYRKSPQYQLANTMATLGEGKDHDRITGDQIAARFLGDAKALQALVVDGVITPEDIVLAKEGGSAPIDPRARDAVANRMRIARENARPEKKPTVDPSRKAGAFAGASAQAKPPRQTGPMPAPRAPVVDLQDQDRGRRPLPPPARRAPRPDSMRGPR